MKKFILGAVAAVIIGFGLTASDASAHWEVRCVERKDPCHGTCVRVQERIWVPDVVIVHPTHERYEHHEHHGHYGHR